MKKIIDTHAHLDHLKDLDSALQKSRESGVEAIVCVSMDLASSKRNLEIKSTTQSPRVYLAMGMHPSEAGKENVEDLAAFIYENKKDLHAIGEIGMDFWYKWVRKDDEKKRQQREVFKRLLEVSKELDLPAIIHARGVWRECFETTKSLGIKKALFHWYSGPVDVLKDIIESGYFVSTSPSVGYSPQSQEAMRNAPIEQTLIETDSPVFYRDSPESESGYESTPADVFKTLTAYCRLKNIDEDQALLQLNQNAKNFFGLNNKS